MLMGEKLYNVDVKGKGKIGLEGEGIKRTSWMKEDVRAGKKLKTLT